MKRTATRKPAKTRMAQSETEPSDTPFPYGDYLKAKKSLEDAIRSGRFFYGCLSGATGTGKTTLMRDLRQSLDGHRHNVIYLSATNVSTIGIARHLAQAIHVAPRRSPLETSQLITQAIRGQAAQVIAWIDEAHRLSPDTLAEINSLAEFDPDAPQVFSVIFSGPAELLTLLDDRRLAALKRRITVRCTLAGLRREELDPFLIHRLGSGGEHRLAREPRDELFERAQGAPALIDAIAREALRRTPGEVNEEILREVLDARSN